jgi:hypothetical protein
MFAYFCNLKKTSQSKHSHKRRKISGKKSVTDVTIFQIFSLKKSAKKWRFLLKTKSNYAKIHNIGFREKRHFFRRKLSKIAQICYPWSP